MGHQPSHTVAQALVASDDVPVTVAGRVLRTRNYGGVTFAQLRDWSGDVQLLLDRSDLDETAPDFSDVDLGDLVEATGHMGYSKNGTRSVLVRQWRLLGKCLRPLPDKRKGLTDPETRLRSRYLDLAVNPEARGLIRARGEILRSIRGNLVRQGASSRSRRRSFSRSTAARTPDRFAPTSTPTTWTSICGSPPSCI